MNFATGETGAVFEGYKGVRIVARDGVTRVVV
jgi:hypothetical protein